MVSMKGLKVSAHHIFLLKSEILNEIIRLILSKAELVIFTLLNVSYVKNIHFLIVKYKYFMKYSKVVTPIN